MGHAELLRWRASQALKVEAEVVEPKEEVLESNEPEVIPQEVEEVEVEKVEETTEMPETSSTEVQESVVEPQELAELETPPIIKVWCTECGSKGRFHKKGCPLKK